MLSSTDAHCTKPSQPGVPAVDATEKDQAPTCVRLPPHLPIVCARRELTRSQPALRFAVAAQVWRTGERPRDSALSGGQSSSSRQQCTCTGGKSAGKKAPRQLQPSSQLLGYLGWFALPPNLQSCFPPGSGQQPQQERLRPPEWHFSPSYIT